jgi:lipopolysaccharide biosynthesis regulator YciM
MAAAEAFVQAEQYDAALGIITDALRNKPEEIELQFELGSIYERSGD